MGAAVEDQAAQRAPRAQRAQHERQRRYYSRHFAGADSAALAPWQASYLERIAEHVLGSSYEGKTLVDVGTGGGYVALGVARLGLRVVACDLTPRAVENVRAARDGLALGSGCDAALEALVCQAERLPLASESADFLVANAVLEHIPDEGGAVAEWKRVVKPGGRLLITVPLELRYVYPWFWPLHVAVDRRVGHLRRYTAESLERVFDLPVVAVMHTGHLAKVLAAGALLVWKNERLGRAVERHDRRREHRRFGASNVVMVFEKPR